MIRGTTLLLAARIVSAISTLALLALVARRFDSATLGALSIGLTLGAIAISAVELGSGGFLVREGARDPEALPSRLGAVIAIRAASVTATLLLLSLIAVWAFPESAAIVFVASASIALQQLAELARAVAISQRRYATASVHSILENVVWLGAIGILVFAGWPLEGALLVGMVWLVASAAIGAVLVKRQHIGVERPDASVMRALLVELRPFAALDVLTTATARVDVLIVGLLAPGGIAAAGGYFAAARLVAAAEFLPEAIGRTLLPEMISRRESATEHLERTVMMLVAIAIPFPALAIAGGDAVMGELFGSEYARLGWLLALLCLALPFRFPSSALGVCLTSLGAQGRRAIVIASALGVTIAIDFALIPAIGIAGAGIASIVSSALVLLVYWLEVKRRISESRLARASSMPLMAGVVAAVAAVLFPAMVPTLGPVAGAIVFLFVYATLVALGAARRARHRGAG
ncbi:MAG TPA: polysaccharide biosynthesis C-terminal domain-containing protein [Vicinamibacterales bacterium]|jgi:O-antigen/teichoic acid export membrane protein